MSWPSPQSPADTPRSAPVARPARRAPASAPHTPPAAAPSASQGRPLAYSPVRLPTGRVAQLEHGQLHLHRRVAPRLAPVAFTVSALPFGVGLGHGWLPLRRNAMQCWRYGPGDATGSSLATANRKLVGTKVTTVTEEACGILSGDAVKSGTERLLFGGIRLAFFVSQTCLIGHNTTVAVSPLDAHLPSKLRRKMDEHCVTGNHVGVVGLVAAGGQGPDASVVHAGACCRISECIPRWSAWG